MERYVIRCTDKMKGMEPLVYYFERFGADGNSPVVGPHPRLYEEGVKAKNTVALLREWAKDAMPSLSVELVELPEHLKCNWRLSLND